MSFGGLIMIFACLFMIMGFIFLFYEKAKNAMYNKTGRIGGDILISLMFIITGILLVASIQTYRSELGIGKDI